MLLQMSPVFHVKELRAKWSRRPYPKFDGLFRPISSCQCPGGPGRNEGCPGTPSCRVPSTCPYLCVMLRYRSTVTRWRSLVKRISSRMVRSVAHTLDWLGGHSVVFVPCPPSRNRLSLARSTHVRTNQGACGNGVPLVSMRRREPKFVDAGNVGEGYGDCFVLKTVSSSNRNC